MFAKNISHVPFKDSNISEADERALTFPLFADVKDIYLKKIDNTMIHHNDRRMRFDYEKLADKGDIIVIAFVPQINERILVKLITEDIYSYSSTPIDYGTNIFKSRNISVSTRGDISSDKPQTKYFVNMPWSDLISIEANTVYLSEAKYIG